MTRRGVAQAILLPVVGLLAWLPSSAQAADEIGLSRDGITWVDELSVPLFESERRWVPGDDETRSVWIRNQGPTGAEVAIEALSLDGDEVLADDLGLSARVDGGPWQPLGLQRRSQNLAVEPLRVGRSARLDLRVTFDSASVNQTQRLALPLTLRITLAEAIPTKDGEAGAGALLPGTGASLGWQVLLVALCLALVGALVTARRSLEDDVAIGRAP